MATVVVLVMAGSVALAHVGDDEVIHACADAKRGDLRVVGAPEDCSKKEEPVHWSVKGPAGENGTDGTNGEVGTIVMTTSGNAWFPHVDSADSTPERWATETSFSAPASAVISLTGPASVNGVEYVLESFDLCVITFGSTYVASVSVTGIAPFGPTVSDDQYIDLFRQTFNPGRTTDCHTFETDGPPDQVGRVGHGAGLMVDVGGVGSVHFSSVRSEWSPAAAQD